jgi:hypothetical protein
MEKLRCTWTSRTLAQPVIVWKMQNGGGGEGGRRDEVSLSLDNAQGFLGKLPGSSVQNGSKGRGRYAGRVRISPPTK